MSEPYVTSVTVNDEDTIELKVMVDDFKAKVPSQQSGQEEIYVEISGQATQTATQTGGAFVNFYDIKEVPASPESDGHYYIYVQGKPAPHQFMDDSEVAVWLRVSRVWLTVLGRPTGITPSGLRAGKGVSWDREISVTQISGDRW